MTLKVDHDFKAFKVCKISSENLRAQTNRKEGWRRRKEGKLKLQS